MADGPTVTDAHRLPGAGPEDPTCAEHPGLGAELRTLVLAALDRLEPALRRWLERPSTGAAGSCAGCPVCALLAVLRGDRPELAAALAEQLGGALAVLRAALAEGDPAAAPDPGAGASAAGTAEPPGPAPARRVQRIPVERTSP